MKIAERIKAIPASLTLAITAKAKAMKAEGIDVVGFGAGEPDFDTPEAIKKAAKDALDAGITKYTPAGGTPEMKKAVCAKMKRDRGLDYTPEQVIINCGGKHSFYNLAQVTLDPGDEVIIPAPYWLSYPEMVKLADGVPVIIDTGVDQDFLATPEQVEKAITKRTVALVLNSPSNPTGMMYTPEQIRAIADVCLAKGVMVWSDEIYEHLIYGDAVHCSPAELSPEHFANTVVLNGMSKTWSMTGWRLGWTCGPKEIIGAMNRLQSHQTSNPTSFAQTGGVVGLERPLEHLDEWLASFDERRRLIVGRLNAIPGIRCPEPKGAFYVFPDVSAFYGKTICGKKVTDSMSFADALLEGANVAIVPGIAFGDDKGVRLSYAIAKAAIEKGLGRIEKALREAS
ncbi:pyridoxal phosphate-dependent aminotransferase [Candidatus Sumerlaeota bacterium]|nr:pyridoxal phosphate-dependent aminotransferase [Candidatus Sumerlaeota bacterium]